MSQYFYLVGKHKEDNSHWEIGGLFSEPWEAESQCTTEYYFVLKLEVGFAYPEETCNIHPTWGWRPKIDPRPDWAIERIEE